MCLSARGTAQRAPVRRNAAPLAPYLRRVPYLVRCLPGALPSVVGLPRSQLPSSRPQSPAGTSRTASHSFLLAATLTHAHHPFANTPPPPLKRPLRTCFACLPLPRRAGACCQTTAAPAPPLALPVCMFSPPTRTILFGALLLPALHQFLSARSWRCHSFSSTAVYSLMLHDASC